MTTKYTNETEGRQKVYPGKHAPAVFLEPGESCDCESDEPRVLDIKPEPKSSG